MMNGNTKKIITALIIASMFFIVAFFIYVYEAVLSYTFFPTSKPTLQILNNPTSEQKRRIASAAGIDAEYKILYVEKWKSREPVLIIWMQDEDNVENSSLYINGFEKTGHARKYDPLGRTFVSGDYYYNNSLVTMFAYKNYFGKFIRYQKIFTSPVALNEIYDIFAGLKEHKAGSLEDYDLWRLQLDQQNKKDM
jgi:hypothetical protein